MKFIHLADLHLGKNLCGFDLLDDQEYIAKQIVQKAVEEKVDAVLIAGDVYDSSLPSEKAVHLLDEILKMFVRNHIKVFMIAGNHDSDERLQFGHSMFELSDVYIEGKYEGELRKVVCEDEYGEVNVYLLPFIKASYVRKYYPEVEIHSYEDAVRVALEHADIDWNARNVILAHQFVVGKGVMPISAGSEMMPAASVGTVEQIACSLFEKFDYVALGHIHSAQQIGAEHIRYAGSPLKYSLSEATHHKTVPFVTLGKKGEREIVFEELQPLRDLRHIKGESGELLKSENLINTNDLIYVTLTDEEPQPNAGATFRSFYPNMVHLDYDNSHQQGIHQVDLSNFEKERPFGEMMEEFYALMYGDEMTEEEKGIMMKLAEEVGISYETN